MNKAIARIGSISANAMRQLMVSAFGLAIPVMVVAISSKNIWGGVVPIVLFTLLAAQISNWGNKEFMLREFSKTPSEIVSRHSENLATRSILLMLTVVISFAYFSFSLAGIVTIWLIGRFMMHSAEPLIIYEKDFQRAIAIEATSFIFFCVALFGLRHQLDTLLLAGLYGSYQFVRGSGLFFICRRFISRAAFSPKSKYITRGFLFFVLSILGFLASKADVYLMTRFGSDTQLGEYQIINSLLVFVMSLSAFIYAPFTKNMYRNSGDVIRKAKDILLISGLVVVPVGIAAAALILARLDVETDMLFWLIAFCYVFPAFAYGLDVVALFRRNKEKTVVVILLIGAVSNFIFSGLLLNEGYGIKGALAGSAISQMMVLSIFKLRRFE